ncbi:hypothetical protein, partial [Enterobacter hormaechei]
PGGAALSPAYGFVGRVIAPPPRKTKPKPKKTRPPGMIKKIFSLRLVWALLVFFYFKKSQ